MQVNNTHVFNDSVLASRKVADNLLKMHPKGGRRDDGNITDIYAGFLTLGNTVAVSDYVEGSGNPDYLGGFEVSYYTPSFSGYLSMGEFVLVDTNTVVYEETTTRKVALMELLSSLIIKASITDYPIAEKTLRLVLLGDLLSFVNNENHVITDFMLGTHILTIGVVFTQEFQKQQNKAYEQESVSSTFSITFCL